MNLHQNNAICGSTSAGGIKTLYVLCHYNAYVHNLSTINTYSEILISVQYIVIGVINKLQLYLHVYQWIHWKGQSSNGKRFPAKSFYTSIGSH